MACCPNRFPDSGESPEFNTVDASLWFVVAVHDLLERAGEDALVVSAADRKRLCGAIQQIVAGYAAGTRYGIRADLDGLLSAGVPGLQLTWMDARVGDQVITPRVGKPVEVQALWLNALRIASDIDIQWSGLFEVGRRSFLERFWNADRGCLHDVVDVDHVPGSSDPTLRPNQILAVGGLPVSVLNGDRARSVVDVVERELLTPFGLRSARANGKRLCTSLCWRTLGARRRLPSRNSLALAAGSVRRGVGPSARRNKGRTVRCPPAIRRASASPCRDNRFRTLL